jgi:16S rRNA processing protein RimM
MTEDLERLVEVGRILKPHGVRGELKVLMHGADVERFRHYRQLTCRLATGQEMLLDVASVRPVGDDQALVRFAQFGAPEPAQVLRDAALFVPRSLCPPLEDDEVYFADVVGMGVLLESTGRRIGSVISIVTGPGQDWLEVALDGDRTVLVPWVEEIVVDIDEDEHVVRIDPPEGLLDL